MQLVRSVAFFCLFAWSLMSCSGLSSRTGAKQDAKPSSGDAVNQLIDTAKLQADVNNVLNSIASGKPDTNALKTAGKDILTTTHNMLSDSGIDKLYGNSNDPSVKSAADMLKKYRNAMGVTPAALDSIKKAAAILNNN